MSLHNTQFQAKRTTIVRQAFAAAAVEYAVFPLRGKVPLTPNGFKNASRDHARVTAMFNAAPNATGYGIACGASALAVLDWDTPEGLAELQRRGMPPTLVVKTPRGGHAYYRTPQGVVVKSRDVAPGLELKAQGAYVVGPGSLHPSGATYRALRDLPVADAPEWMLEPEPEHIAREKTRGAGPMGPIAVDVAGPTIPKGARNRTLARIAGKLHDGTRDLDALTRDLLAVNDGRCTAPLEAGEVAKIAASIHRRKPCKPSGPGPSARVLSAVEYLEAAAAERPVRGMAGASGWAIYLAGLEACRRFGKEHPEGVALSLDMRTWAQMAATEASTVSRWLARTPLVAVVERGSGRRSTTVLFRVPRLGGQLQHSSTRVERLENSDGSVATNPLTRTLYRLRWSGRSHKPRRGVVHGTRMVRQGPPPASREGPARMGKSKGALLRAVVDCAAERPAPGAHRTVIAERLGVKPDSLGKPLKWLMDAGLIVRPSRGHYAPAPALAERLDDTRELGEEPEADRLQIARHGRERDGYRHRHRLKPGRAPTVDEMRQRRERQPFERREAIAAAIARLFAEKPEYRGRRAGQITCQLVNYLAADFPRGADGLPKDEEVAAIMDGVAA